ncbi:MAG: flagellar FliJ family protein [Pseudomonadales bacterium]|jgi:flagellar biosynthesis chaperone FliJ|nr:flagellar FliJ family protein [Pseudomonadales bacterium]
MSSALKNSAQRWTSLAEGVGKEAGEVQRALVEVRSKHSNLCAEQEKIRCMKQDYLTQLKSAEGTEDNLHQSTQLRRFMGQLDMTTRAIIDQLAQLQQQQQTIAARFRELNSERIKFETLASRAKEELVQRSRKTEQKESDMLNALRFSAKTRSNGSDSSS